MDEDEEAAGTRNGPALPAVEAARSYGLKQSARYTLTLEELAALIEGLCARPSLRSYISDRYYVFSIHGYE